jgi:hypothetical protein
MDLTVTLWAGGASGLAATAKGREVVADNKKARLVVKSCLWVTEKNPPLTIELFIKLLT